MSAVRHGVAVKRPCVRIMVTGADIVSGGMAGERFATKKKMNRSGFSKLATNSTGSIQDVSEEGHDEVANCVG